MKMNIFDFNVHLPYLSHEDVSKVIEQDMNLDVAGICNGLEIYQTNIRKIKGVNFLLFNTKLFDEDAGIFFNKSKQFFDEIAYTALVDFRRHDIFDYIEKAKHNGVNAIMFNSYLQKISDADFIEIIKICQFAEKLGLIICIDGSYGTSRMYAHDNLKLACFVADAVSKTPIVIVHSGGCRVIEAFLLADAKPNIWLDTSFSLPYYIGSSLEQDFAFVYKKMNAQKVLFGTDYPYQNSRNAIKIHKKFFNKYGFTNSEQEQIFYKNALELFQV